MPTAIEIAQQTVIDTARQVANDAGVKEGTPQHAIIMAGADNRLLMMAMGAQLTSIEAKLDTLISSL